MCLAVDCVGVSVGFAPVASSTTSFFRRTKRRGSSRPPSTSLLERLRHSAPESNLELQWAFGFNSTASRGAVHYTAKGNVVVGAGSAGVVIHQVGVFSFLYNKLEEIRGTCGHAACTHETFPLDAEAAWCSTPYAHTDQTTGHEIDDTTSTRPEDLGL